MSPRAIAVAAGIALSACVAGCHPIPPPQVLAEADQIATAPASRDAKKLAAAAFARADALRRQAHQAFDDGRRVDAQFLGEQSVAAYAYASAMARLVRADEERTRVSARRERATAELDELSGEQARLDAELASLEARIQVLRDAELPSTSGPASPERERARRQAAVTFVGQARLLCAGAALLAAPPAKPSEALARDLAAAQKSLAAASDELASPASAPIDAARASRAACLAVLTRVRRGRTPITTAPGAGDALLSDLSAAGRFAPARDDRGVVVTIKAPFAGESLSAAAESVVADLVGVSRAHPSFPVLVVLHLDREPKGAEERDRALERAAGVAQRFRAAGAARVEPHLAGAAMPLVDPAGKDRGRNARLEVIFVTPETF